MNVMLIVWLAAAVVFSVAEAITAGLVAIWFAVGAVGALLAALLGASLLVQLLVFILVSAVVVAATRKLAANYIRKDKIATNADRVIGLEARVTEAINPLENTGAVYVDGKTWSARSQTGESVPAGEVVRILHMEGVKLFVEKIKVTEEVK